MLSCLAVHLVISKQSPSLPGRRLLASLDANAIHPDATHSAWKTQSPKEARVCLAGHWRVPLPRLKTSAQGEARRQGALELTAYRPRSLRYLRARSVCIKTRKRVLLVFLLSVETLLEWILNVCYTSMPSWCTEQLICRALKGTPML